MEQYGIQFKEMNKKQKTQHIWEYYRYHILSGIIAIVVAISLGKTIFFPEPPNDVDIMFAGQIYVDSTSALLAEEMKETYQTGIDFTNVNWEGDPEIAGLMLQKIPLMVTTDELDIMVIADEIFEKFSYNYRSDMFMPLEDVPELQDLLEKYADSLFICDKVVDEDGNLVDSEPHVYGIKTDKFSNLPCLIACEEMIVGLNPQAKDFDKAISMLKYILE